MGNVEINLIDVAVCGLLEKDEYDGCWSRKPPFAVDSDDDEEQIISVLEPQGCL